MLCEVREQDWDNAHVDVCTHLVLVTRSKVSQFALSLIPRVPEYEARLLQNNNNT